MSGPQAAKAPTRSRMIASASSLLRRHGAAAVSIDRVLAHSGAPRGSVYHHFPGGRAELLTEAVRFSAAYVTNKLVAAVAAGGPRGLLDGFVEFWRQGLADSDFESGCPVLSVAVEAHRESPELVAAVAEAFAQWRGQLMQALRADGIEAGRADRLATVMLASIEGAIVLCRAQRSLTPLDEVAQELHGLLAGAGPSTRRRA